MSSPVTPASRQIFIRNPLSCIREAVEVGWNLIAWDRGYCVRFNVEPWAHACNYFPPSQNFRLLAIGDQGAAELDRQHSMGNPKAVYPVWEYNQHTFHQLEQLLVTNRAAELRAQALDEGKPPDETPVLGQEHRVVVIRPPGLNTGVGKAFSRDLGRLQAMYEDAIIHYHGGYSYIPLSDDIRAIDLEVRNFTQKGYIMLPSGRKAPYEEARYHRRWLTTFGFTLEDLEDPSERCKFNMMCAMWAGKNWDSIDDWRTSEALRIEDVKKALKGEELKPAPKVSPSTTDPSSTEHQDRPTSSSATPAHSETPVLATA